MDEVQLELRLKRQNRGPMIEGGKSKECFARLGLVSKVSKSRIRFSFRRQRNSEPCAADSSSWTTEGQAED